MCVRFELLDTFTVTVANNSMTCTESPIEADCSAMRRPLALGYTVRRKAVKPVSEIVAHNNSP